VVLFCDRGLVIAAAAETVDAALAAAFVALLRGLRLAAATSSSNQDGAWSLAPASPRTQVLTPASSRMGQS
jgi:hypothetical protein